MRWPIRGRISAARCVHAVLLVLFACVLIFSSSFVHHYSLNAIGGRMVWFNIVAISLCAFAAALCVTR